jgi:hypothetical protein
MAAGGNKAMRTAAAPSKNRRAVVRLLRRIRGKNHVDKYHIKSVGFFKLVIHMDLVLF